MGVKEALWALREERAAVLDIWLSKFEGFDSRLESLASSLFDKCHGWR
jgi:hypothetical protein